ncbi:hypothetical protein AALO_G00279200 [Alosa alosa]|uniref:Uncharacterized protein n=1 Tax=Alosa alosa TaxID=278164 RepID=A0AAV6FJF2_9TELE|nr:hypothetical protein AALO_G00279200 [Alosa alosa]
MDMNSVTESTFYYLFLNCEHKLFFSEYCETGAATREGCPRKSVHPSVPCLKGEPVRLLCKALNQNPTIPNQTNHTGTGGGIQIFQNILCNLRNFNKDYYKL